MLENISSHIFNELKNFNDNLKKSLTTNLSDYTNVLDYIYSNPGKQIRPITGIFLAKILGDFNDKQENFLQVIELIHNATLFHDDIIDESDVRRNKPALHKKFSNKIAILTGDYFLTVALKNMYEIANTEINFLVSSYIQKICEGEIEQNLTLNTIPTLENYLGKTKNKTALLFELTALGISILSDNQNYNDNLKNFGLNFGMYFQIRDDLKNFESKDNKPVLNDLESGVITAPIIFLSQEYNNILDLINNRKYDEILSLLDKSNAKNKTFELMQKYLNMAKESLNQLPDSEYKDLLFNLLS